MSSSGNSGGGGRGADIPSSSRNYNSSGSSNNPHSNQQARNEPGNQRYSSLIYDSELFLTKLREFKPQSLGSLEARRKSSSTLIFPNPQQACMGSPKCPRYPHDIKPTPGYWIECHGPGPIAAANTKPTTSSETYTQANITSPKDDHQLASNDFYVSVQSQRGTENRDTSPSSKLDDLKLNIDCNSGGRLSSTSSNLHRIPTTPTAEKIITRHDEGILSDYDDNYDRKLQTSVGQQSSSSSRNESVKFKNIQSVDETSDSMKKISEKDNYNVRTGQKARGSVKKLNKRTVTRDDIDLHKPRRGTPNITITEPSFNQSTITFQPSSVGVGQANSGNNNNKRPTKQASGEIRRTESIEISSEAKVDIPSQDQTRPKFQIQSFMSIEAQSSIDESIMIADKECSKIFSGHQENSDCDDPYFTGLETNSPSELKLYHQQHRPSIIKEDRILEEEGAAATSLIQTSQQDKSTSDLYCGLSTTNFQKKTYQQSYQESKQNTQCEQLQRDPNLELISFEEENYEKHYYGREHWNYFTNDELLGPVMLSLKQEVNNQRDHFHVLLRTVSYTLHGTIPAGTICADRYDREAIVRELSEIAKLKPPLMLGQLPSTPDELLKLDHIFIKTELKVGVIYIKNGQAESEESILGNKEESPLFAEFLDLLGDRITLKGFDRYKGGLDTVHNLTGIESIYTLWRNIEIMFHVSTMLPHEENDPQKLQKKRHIGNDIVCVAFIESDDTLFWPGCIKSYFLHTFITVRTSPKPLKEGEKRKYSVSCVCRNEVQYAFKPYLIEQDEFFKSDYFREWLLVKIVNGERASYSAPKFARMQDRTRSQLLEDIITNLANHLVTGQIPKPYRRGSWRPLGHTRASSPLEDSMKDYFEDYDQLAKDFQNAFCGPSRSMLCDVVFRVKDKDNTYKLVHGVRAILAIRSRTFLELLYGFVPPGTGHSSLQNQTSLRAIELKALSGESSNLTGRSGIEQTKSLLAKRGSVGADSKTKIGEKERRQSMLPALSKPISQKPNYLTVPSTGGGGGGGSSGTSGMIKNAFNRLVSGNWSGWSGNMKGYKGDPMHIKVDQNKTKIDLNSLAICKEIARIDAEKLSQREFDIKEFDYETFQQTIEYIHNGQCKLSYETIPGLICAAEHYDLPDLLHACFHHANTHTKLSAAPNMMNALYQSSCFYVTAMQLLDSIYEYIDPHGVEFFSRVEYYNLNESVFTTLLSRKTLQVSELQKFQAMDAWTRQQITNKQAQKKLQAQMSLDQQPSQQTLPDEIETEYKSLMTRLNKEVNIKLDKISSDDLVKIVLPSRVFSNDKIFEVMADE